MGTGSIDAHNTMMRVLVLAVAIGLAASLDLDAEWSAFKKTHNKQYLGQEEELYRRRVFEYHLDFIQRHNLEADRGLHTFWTGVNEYADMNGNCKFSAANVGA